MGKFRVIIAKEANKDIKIHRKSGDKKSIKKIKKILIDLSDHPTKGIGKPEKLKHNLSGYWSRRINKKDRMIYSIDGHKVVVTVVSAMGHYADD